ncbi:MAG: NAD(P)(+) transhydrogenase (Re/Si-specific) subunit alpha, partial [Nitratireductor sp.]|nr:NAD(P)(+) transhydrogenase (Re/Si-specific) subunit alpha [Nitratireductor sp.]
MAGRIAATASLLYAKNLLAFLETMVDKENRKLAVNMEDELVKATLLTHDGKIVHPAFVGKGDAEAAAKPAAKPAAAKKPAARKTSKAAKPAAKEGDAQ